MSTQHTQGKLQAGVSIFQGREVFTAVPTDNVQKIVALFGLCGADDEAESIANLLRFVACWNAFDGTSTLTIESMTKPVHEVLFDAGARMNAAEAQRDGLLAQAQELHRQRDMLLGMMKHIEGVAMAGEWRDLPEIAKNARAAIDNVEGGAA